jgi:putative flippase GtrA
MRWLRFNGVGLLGAGVQLGVLAVLTRGLRAPYLVASVAALEVTLLHNFWWHRRVIWRGFGGAVWPALVRFHVANGAVSLVGNVVVMRVLVGAAHVPVVAANAVAIGCCGVVNFWLGEGWVFRGVLTKS